MTTLDAGGRTMRYEAMGTNWAVTLWDNIPNNRYEALHEEILRRTESFERTYSRFIPDSFISRISTQVGVIETPPDLVPMLRLYRALYTPSLKKLNPLIGNTISDLGYDATYSLRRKETIRKTPDLLETLRILDDTHIEIREPALIDLGALGKGYFVDRLAEYLEEEGVREYLVDGSGDIRYQREAGIIRAGLEDPEDHTKAIGVLELVGKGAFCASSGSRRKWANLTHTIDPSTNTSPTEVLAVWVLAKEAALADALATCLSFAPPDNFRPAHDFEHCVMKTGRQVFLSSGFNAQIFLSS